VFQQLCPPLIRNRAIRQTSEITSEHPANWSNGTKPTYHASNPSVLNLSVEKAKAAPMVHGFAQPSDRLWLIRYKTGTKRSTARIMVNRFLAVEFARKQLLENPPLAFAP
jgi:hypothetical protein